MRRPDLEEQHNRRHLRGEPGLSTVTEAAARYESYFVECKRGWLLHNHAIPRLGPYLDALHAAGLRVGLITRGELAFGAEKLRTVGLDSRLEHVIASGALGSGIPDARIFAHTCQLSDVLAPHEQCPDGRACRAAADPGHPHHYLPGETASVAPFAFITPAVRASRALALLQFRAFTVFPGPSCRSYEHRAGHSCTRKWPAAASNPNTASSTSPGLCIVRW